VRTFLDYPIVKLLYLPDLKQKPIPSGKQHSLVILTQQQSKCGLCLLSTPIASLRYNVLPTKRTIQY